MVYNRNFTFIQSIMTLSWRIWGRQGVSRQWNWWSIAEENLCMKADDHSTAYSLTWAAPKQREIIPKKKLQGSSSTSLHFPELVRHFIKAQASCPVASEGNTNILRWLPGRVGNISPSSSILLHDKVFGDPQKFSSELVSLWAVLIQWTQNLQDSQSMIFELVRKVFRNITHLHTNISFWVSVCISATFWLTALHY